MRKIILAAVLFAILAFSTVAIAQDGDETPPVTTKTYGGSSEAGLFEITGCVDNAGWEEVPVLVNGHLITTGTTITLTATDDSGVDATLYYILVPTDCDDIEYDDDVGDYVGFDESEWVGLDDHNIYWDEKTCALAVDDPDTNESEETQSCVQTFWDFDTNALYEDPFTIDQESVHKICFYSVDNRDNGEELQCQVAVVDDAAPEIHSAEVDHEIVDLEYYEGGVYENNYFYDPKCTTFEINASDTHGIDEVQIEVRDVLNSMFYPQISGLPSFSENAWEEYLNDEMHNMPAAEFNRYGGIYTYQFCPYGHIYHLYDNSYSGYINDEYWEDNVIDWDDLLTFISEELHLGQFEFDIWVNDTAGRESHTSVDVAIVDLTVPLEVGWNLRSTPITLDGDRFWSTDDIDAVLRFDSETQTWELVTDNSMEPLDGLFMHATDRNQYGIVFERDVTAPPLRQLHTGWNLAGLALEMWDYYDYYTYLYDDGYTCVGEDALAPIVFGPDGNIALEVAISPYDYLSYDNDGSWYFYQYSWVWIPDIDRGGFEVENDCDEYVQNFGGYWLFMQQPDLLPGQTTTPLPLTYYWD